MKTTWWKRAVMVVLTVGMGLGCAGPTARVNTVPVEHVSEQFVMLESDATDAKWTSLCTRKDCAGAELAYTMLSHDAAVVHESAKLLEGAVGDRVLAERAATRDLHKRVLDLKVQLSDLDANRDFGSEERRVAARILLTHANYYVRDAEDRLHRVFRRFGDAVPGERAALTAEVAVGAAWPELWRSAPALQRARSVLKKTRNAANLRPLPGMKFEVC